MKTEKDKENLLELMVDIGELGVKHGYSMLEMAIVTWLRLDRDIVKNMSLEDLDNIWMSVREQSTLLNEDLCSITDTYF